MNYWKSVFFDGLGVTDLFCVAGIYFVRPRAVGLVKGWRCAHRSVNAQQDADSSRD